MNTSRAPGFGPVTPIDLQSERDRFAYLVARVRTLEHELADLRASFAEMVTEHALVREDCRKARDIINRYGYSRSGR